jgi:hypothetical protein
MAALPALVCLYKEKQHCLHCYQWQHCLHWTHIAPCPCQCRPALAALATLAELAALATLADLPALPTLPALAGAGIIAWPGAAMAQ